MNKKMIIFLVCLVLFFSFGIASAFCAKDLTGHVYCSQFVAGTIVKDNVGNLVCGKGECRKDNAGNYKCSKVPGGGAEIDAVNDVLCLGGCEPASSSMCVEAEK